MTSEHEALTEKGIPCLNTGGFVPLLGFPPTQFLSSSHIANRTTGLLPSSKLNVSALWSAFSRSVIARPCCASPVPRSSRSGKCKTNHVKKVLGNACRILGGSRATFKGLCRVPVFLLCGFILR